MPLIKPKTGPAPDEPGLLAIRDEVHRRAREGHSGPYVVSEGHVNELVGARAWSPAFSKALQDWCAANNLEADEFGPEGIGFSVKSAETVEQPAAEPAAETKALVPAKVK